MIIRTYQCVDCEAYFEVECSSNDPDPPCPACEKILEWKPVRFAIGGSQEGKAVALAQEIMEQDYGLTNFKDNNKEGDVGYIDPTRKTAAERDAQLQREAEAGREFQKRLTDNATPEQKKQVDTFFSGQSLTVGQNRIPAQTMLANAKAGPEAKTGLGAMDHLHRLGREGKLPSNMRIVARATMD